MHIQHLSFHKLDVKVNIDNTQMLHLEIGIPKYFNLKLRSIIILVAGLAFY